MHKSAEAATENSQARSEGSAGKALAGIGVCTRNDYALNPQLHQWNIC
jgi:hypothetical protein